MLLHAPEMLLLLLLEGAAARKYSASLL